MKNLKLLLILSIMVFLFTGCSNKELTMENKIDSEVEFCESRVLVFLKNLEYDVYKKEEDLDWEKIKKDNDIFLNNLPIIEADLSYVKFDNNKIEEIKNIVENIKKYIDSKEIEKIKLEYGSLYKKILQIKNNKNRELKNICIGIYLESINQNNSEIISLITELENRYNEVIKEKEFLDKSKLSLQKIKDNIDDIKNSNEENDYTQISMHSIKLIEIM